MIVSAAVAETPNLLDLLESRWATSADSLSRDLSVADDDFSAPFLSRGAVCSDETIDPSIGFVAAGTAVCSDDEPASPVRAPMASVSVCSDDGPVPGLSRDDHSEFTTGLSLCSDDGDDSSLPSDVRLKTDIEQVGTTVYGLPLFHFRYKTGEERFEGVMAQDVLDVMPDAVSRGSNGFYRVNYAKLGIAMTKVSASR